MSCGAYSDSVSWSARTGHQNDDPRVGAERVEVRRQGADQHVVLALDLADLRLSDAEVGGQLHLRQTGCPTYRGKVDHASILLSRSTACKEYWSASGRPRLVQSRIAHKYRFRDGRRGQAEAARTGHGSSNASAQAPRNRSLSCDGLESISTKRFAVSTIPHFR
jgi:hypothetical protein